ncbi:MAG: ABC transporter permease [Clostridia bacterium]|nr:ABC transporter permease [Clostridia bacterium]
MIPFTVRNLKVFFKDRSAVFFSLLSVMIIFALYALFLGDVWTAGIKDLDNARFIMDSWICAGMLAVTSVTATMGAFGIMVEDKTRKIYKDFYVSPAKKYEIMGGYLLSAVLIGIIMTLVTLVLSEIYILAYGGKLLGFSAFMKVLGLVVLTTLTNTSVLFFLVSFFSSSNAFSTASTIIGTLIGFLTGIYLPVGMLPKAVQYIVKVFPPSYAASLFRQVIMDAPIQSAFADIPAEYLVNFQSEMGVTFAFGDYTVPVWLSIVILIATAILFYGLAIWNISRKKKN